MNFLNPAFLISLAAVALPLIVHFFSRRRVPRVRFSSLAFLRPSQRRSMKRINFRRWLLLALRIAAVALVALAFSRPVIEGALVPGSAPTASCIILDRSYSMGLESERGTPLERGRGIAGEIISGAGNSDRVILSVLDTGVEEIFDMEGRGREFALEALEGIEPSWKPADLGKGLLEGARTLRKSGYGVRQLYLISDFRAGTDRNAGTPVDSAEAGPGIGGKTATYLIPIHESVSGNVALIDIRRPGVAIHAGEVVTIGATLLNSSGRAAETVPVSISVEGERLINRELRLGPGERRYQEFSFPVEEPGWLRGEIELGDDRLRYDNRRLFVIHVIEKIDVLLVGEGQYYLEKALSPGGAEGDIRLRVSGPERVTSSDIRDSDAVVLGGGPELWDEDLEVLREYLEGGGGAVIFVRENLVETAAALSRHSPAIELERRERTLEDPGTVPEILHPFTREEISSLSRVRFVAEPVVKGIPSPAVAMRYKDRSPFMWQERIGEGRAVFIVCRPAVAGGGLVLSPYFLPIVQQAVFSVAGGGGAGGEFLVGKRPRWRINDKNRPAIYFQPYGEERPGVRLDYRFAGDELIAAPVDRPGYLNVISDNRTVRRAAVNPDCSLESRLDYIQPEVLADSMGIDRAKIIEEGEGAGERINEARYGREITGWVIIAALIIFIIELMVAQGAARRRSEDVGKS
ncbi:MAG: hypothetical protein GF417_04890 [Candidatus Latescibacteria bacterium]|nr:hypothetical protein [bacterium]MBD3423757.1 hypothetical protein [Candidatus Latescibacterota bacterium]